MSKKKGPFVKKHSHEFLGDGKLKVWCESDIGDFTITVPEDISKEDLDKAVKKEYAIQKKQKARIKELGIGEEVNL